MKFLQSTRAKMYPGNLSHVYLQHKQCLHVLLCRSWWLITATDTTLVVRGALLTDAPFQFLKWVTTYFDGHLVYSFIVLTHQKPPYCPQIVCTAGPTTLTDKRLNLWLMTEMNPTQQSLKPHSQQLSKFEGWVGICYIFCPQEGLPWYKVLQNFLFLYKNKHFCRNPAF